MAQLEGKHRDEIEELRQQMRIDQKTCEMKIENLISRVTDLEDRNNALEGKIHQSHDVYSIYSTRESEKEYGPERKKNSSSINVAAIVNGKDDHSTVVENEIKHTQRNKATNRRGFNGLNVAFSAFMDHDTNNMGPGQTLIYQQVLLNEGDCYNKHTGIFTAPVSGVYSFSFFVGERDINGVWVSLCVNSDKKIFAAVDTWHPAQDLQGGNTANLKLAPGDVVYVKNHDGSHVEGHSDGGSTTFSGFLIYPV